MTCNALRPGHHDMPPRCGRIDNHDGPHRSSEGIVAAHVLTLARNGPTNPTLPWSCGGGG